MNNYDKAVMLATECLGIPYVWGGDDPRVGLDCSGLIGHILRNLGVFPPGYDNTSQGYYDYFKSSAVTAPLRGCLAFYGKNGRSITHVDLIVSERLVIGAMKGTKYIDTIKKAKLKKARVDWRLIKYRRNRVLIADPFKEERNY